METMEERVVRLRKENKERIAKRMSEIKENKEKTVEEQELCKLQRETELAEERAELEAERNSWKPGGCKSCRMQSLAYFRFCYIVKLGGNHAKNTDLH